MSYETLRDAQAAVNESCITLIEELNVLKSCSEADIRRYYDRIDEIQNNFVIHNQKLKALAVADPTIALRGYFKIPFNIDLIMRDVYAAIAKLVQRSSIDKKPDTNVYSYTSYL